MVEGVLHRQHPAPGLPDDRVPAIDAQMPRELHELVLEELRSSRTRAARRGDAGSFRSRPGRRERMPGRTSRGLRSARSSRGPRPGPRDRSRPVSARSEDRARRERGTRSRARSMPSGPRNPPPHPPSSSLAGSSCSRDGDRVSERMVACGEASTTEVGERRTRRRCRSPSRIGSVDESGTRRGGLSGSALRPRARSAREAMSDRRRCRSWASRRGAPPCTGESGSRRARRRALARR